MLLIDEAALRDTIAAQLRTTGWHVTTETCRAGRHDRLDIYATRHGTELIVETKVNIGGRIDAQRALEQITRYAVHHPAALLLIAARRIGPRAATYFDRHLDTRCRTLVWPRFGSARSALSFLDSPTGPDWTPTGPRDQSTGTATTGPHWTPPPPYGGGVREPVRGPVGPAGASATTPPTGTGQPR